MQIDSIEVIRALKAFFRPKDVFEIRVLEATTQEYYRPHTEAGYFDYEHIEAVPQALQRLKGYKGVYVTANPVTPALIARSANRIQDIKRNPTTSDKDILQRRWLLVDCDAVRPSGIASNSEEHQHAINRANEIKLALETSQLKFECEPIMTDSGNGAQLMYPIDIDIEDNSLIQQVLYGLNSVFSDKLVDIDVTVHNPARIWRLPGTWNVKGDEFGDRVHRQAKIIQLPNDVNRQVPVSLEALQEWAKTGEDFLQAKSGKKATNSTSLPVNFAEGETFSDFNLDEWIAKYCPELGEAKPWQGGKKWVFDVCPFNVDHTDRSAVLMQQPNGAIAFKCHHNGCSGNDWHKLRELRDVEFANRGDCLHGVAKFGGVLPDTTPTVQPPPKATTKQNSGKHADPGPIPDRLLQVGGFIQQVMEYTLSTAPYPNQVLAFAGALTLTSFLTSRKYRDISNNMTNIYLIALANSGSGKDHPRKINNEIAHAAGMATKIGDSFASGEGIEDAMMTNQVMLFQTDEIDGLFNSINKAKDGRNEMIMNILLKFYSSSNSVYTARAKAYSRNNANSSPSCERPGLTLFGTAIPKFLYESLNGRMLENGFFARTLILEADSRGRGQEAEYLKPPKEVVEVARYWASFVPINKGADGSGDLFDLNPEPYCVPYSDSTVRELYANYRMAADDLYAKYEKKSDMTATALWNRAFEKARKLALLYALSENPEEPVLTKEAIQWGWEFACYQTKRQLYMAESYVADNPFHLLCLKFMRKLKANGGTIERRTIMRHMSLKLTELEQVEKFLIDSGEIINDWRVTQSGKSQQFYKTIQ